MLSAICPTLPARDLHATADFYARIGFRRAALYEQEGYLILERDGLEIHFWRKPEHVPEVSEFGAYLRCEDVDALAAPISALGLSDTGIPRFEPPQDKPWGMREANLIDPEGHVLRIGQDLDDG